MSSIGKTSNNFRSDSSHGRVRETGVVIGIVKGNADPQRMGRLAVYIPEFGGDPADPQTWYTVGYASPFAGATDLEANSDSGSAMKEMSGTQKSYGFWAVPPDINNQVLVCFVNGDTARGYWFGCLYQQFMNHMVPALGLNRSTKPEIDAQNLPPVCEYNRKDTSQNVWDPLRPVFEPLHNALSEQGLYTDPERGPATTGARRESPSKVMGLLSPRGNSIHIDDLEENEFIRLRTRGGVQVLIHETTGYIYFISKKGDSWVEISDEGIDMYTKRSINMRAEESINMHADKNINSQGSGAIHTRGGNHTHASETQSTTHVAGDKNTVAGGKSTTDAQGGHNRNGPQIKDGSNPSNPDSVKSNGSGGNGSGGNGNGSGNGSGSGTGSGSGSGSGNGSGSGSGNGSGYNERVRGTVFYKGNSGWKEGEGDYWTDRGMTSTGPKVREATETQVGTAAVDPNKIPYGSQITLQTKDGPRYYIASDTGSALVSETASRGSARVIDFYAPKQTWSDYTTVNIVPYSGSTPYRRLSLSQKESFFDISRFK